MDDSKLEGFESRYPGGLDKMSLIKLTPKLLKELAKGVKANLDEQGERIPEINFPEFDLKGILTCGACPVQYEGTIGTKYWYFRSRHSYWYFAVADTKDEAVLQEGWFLDGEIKDASWIPHKTAVELIRQGAATYIGRPDSDDDGELD